MEIFSFSSFFGHCFMALFFVLILLLLHLRLFFSPKVFVIWRMMTYQSGSNKDIGRLRIPFLFWETRRGRYYPLAIKRRIEWIFHRVMGENEWHCTKSKQSLINQTINQWQGNNNKTTRIAIPASGWKAI